MALFNSKAFQGDPRSVQGYGLPQVKFDTPLPEAGRPLPSIDRAKLSASLKKATLMKKGERLANAYWRTNMAGELQLYVFPAAGSYVIVLTPEK